METLLLILVVGFPIVGTIGGGLAMIYTALIEMHDTLDRRKVMNDDSRERRNQGQYPSRD
jgi:hypothetical protein